MKAPSIKIPLHVHVGDEIKQSLRLTIKSEIGNRNISIYEEV